MIQREQNRVCYIESRPEWFSYGVLRLFYRNADWLFVPLQDVAPADRSVEYQKAEYFFISGYGHADVAIAAYAAGCIIVGVRADVPNSVPVVESKPWDPFKVYGLLRFYEVAQFFPAVFRPFIRMVLSTCSRGWWYARLGFRVLANESFRSIVMKVKKFLYWS